FQSRRANVRECAPNSPRADPSQAAVQAPAGSSWFLPVAPAASKPAAETHSHDQRVTYPCRTLSTHVVRDVRSRSQHSDTHPSRRENEDTDRDLQGARGV